jgi:hypothetical protein
MRTVLLVAGAWVAVVGAGVLSGWVLWCLGADRRLEECLTELAVRYRLRPRGGHVEASPIEAPLPPAVMNGGRKVTSK